MAEPQEPKAGKLREGDQANHRAGFRHLAYLVTHLKEAWDENEEGMLKLQQAAAQENVDNYKEAFDKDYFDFEAVHQQAETFLESFHEPEAEEEPDYQALAPTKERERADCIRDLKDELADAEGDLEKAPTSVL